MQSSKSVDNPVEHMTSFGDNRKLFLERGMYFAKVVEPTLNSKGNTYHVFGPPEQNWMSSLPDSALPLLDAGACFGAQTIHALKSGRDVIAIDMCEEHMNILRERVAKLEDGGGNGKLIRSIITQLPDSDAIADESVAGILCSEVIHFLKPGQLRPLFNHFFRWLAPGGKVVVIAAAFPAWIQYCEEQGFTLPQGRSAEDALEMPKNLSPSELVDAAPGLLFAPDDDTWKKTIGEVMHIMSTEELRELAECSGFVVEDVRYYHSGKYGNERTDMKLESALLVARKPNQ